MASASKTPLAEIRFDDVRGKRLLVALSGGADSVALLQLLWQQRESCDLHITAAHLHHGIRGSAADGDLAYCRALCEKLGIRLIEAQIDVPRIAQEKKLGLESAAREARYRFLEAAKADCGADLIALAHHMDDQAETILMHLLRGAGPEGICGMPRLHSGLYRPLLGVHKDELRQYLAENGIAWREDESNGVSDNPRNALRLHVLPQIEKSYPRAAEAIARYGRLARIESDFIAREADAFMARNVDLLPCGPRIRFCESADEVLLRRCIRRICGDKLCAEKLDELIVLARSSRGKTTVFNDLLAEKTPNALYFLRTDRKLPPPAKLAAPGDTLLAGICRVHIEEGDFDPLDNPDGCETIDAGALSGAVLRTRLPGDRIRPLGAPGDRLLSDHLSDRKIDRPLRDIMPLICAGNRVLWTGGAGIAREAAVTEASTRKMRISLHKLTEEERGGIEYEE